MSSCLIFGNLRNSVWSDAYHELDSYPQRVLIMDNERFHRGGNLNQIAKQYNLTLLYLPPYSPELNPVENKWAVVKQNVQLSMSQFESLNDCVIHCSV